MVQYFGLVLGIYHINDEEDAMNRFFASSGEMKRKLTSKSAEAFQIMDSISRADNCTMMNIDLPTVCYEPKARFILPSNIVQTCELPIQIQIQDNIRYVNAWNWTLTNNGQTQTSSVQNPNFEINQIGEYQLSLVVTDA